MLQKTFPRNQIKMQTHHKVVTYADINTVYKTAITKIIKIKVYVTRTIAS